MGGAAARARSSPRCARRSCADRSYRARDCRGSGSAPADRDASTLPKTIRVSGSAARSPAPAARPCSTPDVSAARRASQSGNCDSRYSVQVSALAVVSWPAKMKVMTLSKTSASPNSAPPSGSRAVSSAVSRSSGAAPSSRASDARRRATNAFDLAAEEFERAARAQAVGGRHPFGQTQQGEEIDLGLRLQIGVERLRHRPVLASSRRWKTWCAK